MENANGKRLALIINEFGDLGVDGEILRGCGDATCSEEDVLELTNGCICCTVADDFIPTLETLLERDEKPDHIVIETSGLALPKPLIKAFQWPEVRSRTTVDGVVAVVDGPAVKAGMFADDPASYNSNVSRTKAWTTTAHWRRFLRINSPARIWVVSKSDLLEEGDAEAVIAKIRQETRQSVKALTAYHGKVDAALLLGLDAAVEDDVDKRKTHHDSLEDDHDHDDFDSFILDLPSAPAPEALMSRVTRPCA